VRVDTRAGECSTSPAVAEQRTVKVEGMTCTGCEQRLSSSLNQLEGIRDVTADHQAGEVHVIFDPASVSSAVIEGRIRDVGYTVSD
jgi:copper chaperone